MRAPRSTIPLIAAATLLSGCIVAAVPIAAGGMIARKAVTGGAHPAATSSPGLVDPGVTPSLTPAGTEAVPSDASRMVPGTFYAGQPPVTSPASGTPTPVADTDPIDGVVGARAEAGWPALVRFVATNRTAQRHGALLVRGGAPSDPRWLSCAGKPRAVLAPVSLVLSGDGEGRRIAERDLGWIVALPTMGTAIVLIAGSPAEAAAARAAFKQAGLAAPVAGDTMVMATSDADLPAARAAVGARYCVVAVAGRRAPDFPNALLPASTPAALADQWRAGWFLFGSDTR